MPRMIVRQQAYDDLKINDGVEHIHVAVAVLVATYDSNLKGTDVTTWALRP